MTEIQEEEKRKRRRNWTNYSKARRKGREKRGRKTEGRKIGREGDEKVTKRDWEGHT
jgi:hypothetical protein